MRKVLVLLLISMISAIGLAQDKKSSKRNAPSKKQLKVIAREEINQLHDGALLIRLQTKRKSTAALRKAGKGELADKVESRQEKYNQTIVSAFVTHFNFCPTYFFYSHNSKDIREGKFETVEFLDHHLQPDSTIEFGGGNFLTAEFGTIEEDTATYFADYDLVNTDQGVEQQARYYGGTNMGFGALIIKSDKFHQLHRPFPFYVRNYDSLPTKRDPDEVVIKMNRKLNDFFNEPQ